MKRRRRMDDDEAWVDKEPAHLGHIGQLTDSGDKPKLVGVKNPIGFCTVPGAHKGQKPARWRKVTIRTHK